MNKLWAKRYAYLGTLLIRLSAYIQKNSSSSPAHPARVSRLLRPTLPSSLIEKISHLFQSSTSPRTRHRQSSPDLLRSSLASPLIKYISALDPRTVDRWLRLMSKETVVDLQLYRALKRSKESQTTSTPPQNG